MPISRKRRDWGEVFLDGLMRGLSVINAAVRARVAPSVPYVRRKRDPDFALAWAEALEIGTPDVEAEAARRAYHGTIRPVYYKGQRCGSIREYSDTLLMFILRARKPEVYRENGASSTTNVSLSVNVAAAQVVRALIERGELSEVSDYTGLINHALSLGAIGRNDGGDSGTAQHMPTLQTPGTSEIPGSATPDSPEIQTPPEPDRALTQTPQTTETVTPTPVGPGPVAPLDEVLEEYSGEAAHAGHAGGCAGAHAKGPEQGAGGGAGCRTPPPQGSPPGAVPPTSLRPPARGFAPVRLAAVGGGRGRAGGSPAVPAPGVAGSAGGGGQPGEVARGTPPPGDQRGADAGVADA